MRINELVFALQNLFQASFKILVKLGNFPNVLFIVIGFILFFIWLKQMIAYNREAAENGTLK